VQGDRLNAQCKAILSKERGDQVTISEIKTKLVGAGSYLLPRTAPVIFEIHIRSSLNVLFDIIIIP
jgi:hypothetical protein